MNWIITAKTGTHKGTHWPIASQPIILGRGLYCDIVINDPIVSRRHCRLFVEGDQVYLEDLGSSHHALVNGQAVLQHVLDQGDTLSLGSHTFIVTRSNKTVSFSVAAPPHDETLRLFDGAGVSRFDSELSSLIEGWPQSMTALVKLFKLGRALSQATSHEELHRLCMGCIREKLAPARLGIALRTQGDRAWQWHPEDSASDDVMQRVCEAVCTEKKALLKPLFRQDGGAHNLDHLMAAPLCVGGNAIGAFVVCGATREGGYDETELHLLLSIAQVAAPYYQTLARVDALQHEVAILDDSPASGWPLLGKSRAIREARGLIRDMARTPLNVLITGETGTGKELAAQMLHEGSVRAGGPLVSVNCAAIPDHLFESEMFGHEKGAFTSAEKKRRGRFALAHEGTLFLDEIGELSLENQARLLRVLERGVFHAVGAEQESHADVRVIAATNRDLKRAIQDGRFRRDLFHRICAIEIELPPLRQRPSDIPLLAQHFFHDYTARNKHTRLGISPEAMERLQQAPWPGNVRELRNAIERATALAKGDYVRPADLNFLAHTHPGHIDDPDNPHGNALLPLAEVERQHIVKVLEACGFNISAAARVLGVHRNTLHNKIAEYGIGG